MLIALIFGDYVWKLFCCAGFAVCCHFHTFQCCVCACCTFIERLLQALVKRGQELTPGVQEQAAVLNLVTKIQSVLDNLVVAPTLFEAAVCCP